MFLIRPLRHLMIVSLLLAQGGISMGTTLGGSESEWKLVPMDEIRMTYESKTLSDSEIVARLVRYLDQRITMARTHPGHTQPTPGSEYATLLTLIAERPYPATPKGRPTAIHAVLKSLDSTSDISNVVEVRALLYLALGLAGEPHSPEILGFLDSQNSSPELLMIALRSLEHSEVPIRALPSLLRLSTNPWSTIDPKSMGHPRTERKFPVREAVFGCLQKLDVKVELIRSPDAQPDSLGRRLEITTINIDRPSLVEQLRKRLRSDNPQTKAESLDIAQRIGGEDVKAMLKEESLKH